MEKFFLGGLFVCNELNVVHQKNVAAAVLIVERRSIVFLNIMNQLIGKVFAAGVKDDFIRSLFFHLVHDCGKQMRFSETGVAVNEQGIIGFSGIVCHVECRCVRKAVGWTDDEIVKGVIIIFRKGDDFFAALRLRHPWIKVRLFVWYRVADSDRKAERSFTSIFNQF